MDFDACGYREYIESELIKYQEWLNDAELDETSELYNEAMVYSYIKEKIK